MNGYMYDFSVDHYTIGVSGIVEIHGYLMKKHDMKKKHGMFRSNKQALTQLLNSNGSLGTKCISLESEP